MFSHNPKAVMEILEDGDSLEVIFEVQHLVAGGGIEGGYTLKSPSQLKGPSIQEEHFLESEKLKCEFLRRWHVIPCEKQ